MAVETKDIHHEAATAHEEKLDADSLSRGGDDLNDQVQAYETRSMDLRTIMGLLVYITFPGSANMIR